MDYILAFVIGGIICVLSQILMDTTKLMPGRVMVILVCTGVILGAVGIYEPFMKFAGAGAFSDGKLSLSPDVGGNLPEILSILFEKNPSVRIVVTAILLETALEACESLEAFTLKPAEIMQLQVSRSKKAGKGHMLCANNPIFLISAGGCADE